MATEPKFNARLTAVQLLVRLLVQGESLSALLADPRLQAAPPKDLSLTKALVFGVCRYHRYLAHWVDQRLKKPFKKKDMDLYAVLLVGVYQIAYLRIPDHAAVSESVSLTKRLGKDWASGLCNAVLRNFQANPEPWQQDQENLHWALPDWLLTSLQRDWPEDWESVCRASLEQPPLWLRVNSAQTSREAYLQMLAEQGRSASVGVHAADALLLDSAADVAQLPLFADGMVSVQDQAAQLAADLLALAPGLSVLDVCAAPGGKSLQMLERTKGYIELTALDVDAQRMKRVEENLTRGGFQATLLVGDGAQPAAWWDGKLFDRILLDAPCSGTGVIRRHPDIKLLRQAADIPALVQLQAKLLQAIWPLLAPGGILVYSTCSILKQENEEQVHRFLSSTQDAREKVLTERWGRASQVGRQILPGEEQMDGFYYARLEKI